MKVSFKQVRLFRINAIKYLSDYPQETKLKYALQKTIKQTNDIEKQWSEILAEIEIDHAFTDKNGIIQYKTSENGQREYQYTKDGLKARDKAVNEAFEQADNEIESYQLSEFPKDIDTEWLEVFSPFIEKVEKLKVAK